MFENISINLKRFLPEIEEYLHEVKNESKNGVKHKGLFSSEEIFEFLSKNFGEFDSKTLDKLFETFGFKTNQLFVFFSDKQTGLFAMQTPWYRPFNSYQDATATFAWYQDKETNNKVFEISGVRDNHIIAARYVAPPNNQPYKLKSFDCGVNESHNLTIFYRKELKEVLDRPPSALITEQMLKITKVNKIFHISSGIGSLLGSSDFFRQIPNTLYQGQK